MQTTSSSKKVKLPTWYVVRRGGNADYQRCFEGIAALPFPYISGPYLTQKLAEAAAAAQRYEDNAPLRESIARINQEAR
jgi:hypothetical protein